MVREKQEEGPKGTPTPAPEAPRGHLVTKRTPRTYPDFVILCLVLQILIKLLLRVELNAVYFKLFANLERQGSGWQEAESVSTGSAPAPAGWEGR